MQSTIMLSLKIAKVRNIKPTKYFLKSKFETVYCIYVRLRSPSTKDVTLITSHQRTSQAAEDKNWSWQKAWYECSKAGKFTKTSGTEDAFSWKVPPTKIFMLRNFWEIVVRDSQVRLKRSFVRNRKNCVLWRKVRSASVLSCVEASLTKTSPKQT